MKYLVFFLEELSAAEMLNGLVPRLLSTFPNRDEDICVKYIHFEGKNDLQKQLPSKLRGWNLPNTVFVVIRDKDGGDGPTIKNQLNGLCNGNTDKPYLIRIACHELESWYLGDLYSVETALEIRNLSNKQNKNPFRQPDNVANAAQELIKITSKKYTKVLGSRMIGKTLKIKGNTSHSYNVFISGLIKIISTHLL
ncbi:DUF4276 family protein [Dickeya zeae]|uniref:DUF4276 family protein n=1 Tax=Dickeya zeae TaxID=204042 RepID=A0ABX8W223_9GAMM|nr:DUF4276 family protein [Dickeya zeae]QYM92256.1 DUF4276 family protein [Dickeya zeae]